MRRTQGPAHSMQRPLAQECGAQLRAVTGPVDIGEAGGQLCEVERKIRYPVLS